MNSWRGQVQMGLGWGLFAGHAGDGDAHAHHAVQILLADTPQWVWTPQTQRRACTGLVIGADVEHRVEPTTAAVTMLYVEPHSALGRRLRATLTQGLHALDITQVKAAQNALRSRPDEDSIAALIDLIASQSESDTAKVLPAGDARIQSLLDTLPEALPERLTAAVLAERVGLSESRFLHCFAAHTGLPLRPYLRWRRLLVAMSRIMAGRTLTEAAIAAGFADSAHFTRTFRRHFGIAPRNLIGLHARR